MGRRLRPAWQDVSSLQYDLHASRILGADQTTIDLLQSRYDDLRIAYEHGEFLTDPVSVCAAGLDRAPLGLVYKRPVLLLIDEFSASAAESFAAQFQDNLRGKLYGWRTAGAGGSVVSQALGFYSESGTASVTVTEQCRKEPVSTPDYPTTIYVENVGVRPDIWADYMRADTFSQNGKPFVDGFLDAITTEIKRTR
jgi:C-terminal processing protease CtpA/Prc